MFGALHLTGRYLRLRRESANPGSTEEDGTSVAAGLRAARTMVPDGLSQSVRDFAVAAKATVQRQGGELWREGPYLVRRRGRANLGPCLTQLAPSSASSGAIWSAPCPATRGRATSPYDGAALRLSCLASTFLFSRCPCILASCTLPKPYYLSVEQACLTTTSRRVKAAVEQLGARGAPACGLVDGMLLSVQQRAATCGFSYPPLRRCLLRLRCRCRCPAPARRRRAAPRATAPCTRSPRR